MHKTYKYAIVLSSALFIAPVAFAEADKVAKQDTSFLGGVATVSQYTEKFNQYFWDGLNFTNQAAISPSVNFVSEKFYALGDQYQSSTAMLMDGLSGIYNSAAHLVVSVASLPVETLREFTEKLSAKEKSAFLSLIGEAGFIVTEVNVGFDFFPELSVYFEKQKILTDSEQIEVTKKIEVYVEQKNGPTSFIEAFILRSLLKASDYSETLDIKAADVSVFPIPGLTLVFDPTRKYWTEERRNEVSFEKSEEAIQKQKVIENRIAELEKKVSRALTLDVEDGKDTTIKSDVLPDSREE